MQRAVIAIAFCWLSLTIVPVQAAETRSKRLQTAITKYQRTLSNQHRIAVGKVNQSQLKAEARGDLKTIEALDEELDKFVATGKLPASTTNESAVARYKKTIEAARKALIRAYESEIKRKEKSGDAGVVAQLSVELNSLQAETEFAPTSYFFAGTTFTGTRTTHDNKRLPYQMVIVDFDGKSFSGYVLRIVRTAGNRTFKSPIAGTVDGRSIEFREKGLPGGPLELVDLQYTGKLQGGQARLDFSGTGGGGNDRSGHALVTHR